MIDTVLLAFGLAGDAFAAAVCRGMTAESARRRIRWGDCLTVGICFGAFQALMPLLGRLIGNKLPESVHRFGHYAAFGVLGLIGSRMIFEAIRETRRKRADKGLRRRDERRSIRAKRKEPCAEECAEDKDRRSKRKDRARSRAVFELLFTAFATSLDALAIGITFSISKPDIGIGAAVLIIGAVTFALSALGVLIGGLFGDRYAHASAIAGGSILCLLGLKALFEGIGMI